MKSWTIKLFINNFFIKYIDVTFKRIWCSYRRLGWYQYEFIDNLWNSEIYLKKLIILFYRTTSKYFCNFGQRKNSPGNSSLVVIYRQFITRLVLDIKLVLMLRRITFNIKIKEYIYSHWVKSIMISSNYNKQSVKNLFVV